MDLSSTFIWSYVQRLRPYSSTWKQCLDLTQDIVYNKDILGRSSYNLPKTVSHISCFLQGESQVQPPKYKIQTHTHKYNCQSFKSKNPPEINMAIEPNPKPSCLRQQATPLSALVAILVGVLVGLLVRWLLRCRLDHHSSMNMLSWLYWVWSFNSKEYVVKWRLIALSFLESLMMLSCCQLGSLLNT